MKIGFNKLLSSNLGSIFYSFEIKHTHICKEQSVFLLWNYYIVSQTLSFLFFDWMIDGELIYSVNNLLQPTYYNCFIMVFAIR